MPPKLKKTFEATLELEAGNAAMVDLGKMLGPTGVNTRNVKSAGGATPTPDRFPGEQQERQKPVQFALPVGVFIRGDGR